MIDKTNIKQLLLALFSGYSFREKVEHDPQGDVAVIQMKDLEDNYQTIGNSLTYIASSTISSDKYYLQKGDVLFLAKGANNFAVEYAMDLPKTIAASAFFILRPDQAVVLPAYLAWYINQQPVQQYLKENMAGSYIPNVNKGTIEGIEIVLPSLEKQKLIVAIEFLRKKEYLLTEAILWKKKEMIQKGLLDYVNNEKYDNGKREKTD